MIRNSIPIPIENIFDCNNCEHYIDGVCYHPRCIWEED